MLIDSHCHLDYLDREGDDLEGVLARAAAADVGLMVTIGTTIEGFEKVRAIAARFDNVYCTVGVHPHEAAGAEALEPETLVRLAAHPKVVGIGETGLDYYYEHSPREVQAALFRRHIAVAREIGLPVVVHTRDADADTIAILRDEMARGVFTGLIHCFSTSRQLAEEAIELGLYISLSGIVTFKSAAAIRETTADLPLDRLLVETDSPYLAPVPHRGKRNEPAFVAHTAAAVAALRGMAAEDFAAATSRNFFRLFTKVPEAA